jgi:hypothetical protein
MEIARVREISGGFVEPMAEPVSPVARLVALAAELRELERRRDKWIWDRLTPAEQAGLRAIQRMQREIDEIEARRKGR